MHIILPGYKILVKVEMLKKNQRKEIKMTYSVEKRGMKKKKIN